MLHRSGLPSQDMLGSYLYKIRPVVEYACQMWNVYDVAESTLLETIQRRALRIIYRYEDSYTALLIKADCYTLLNQIQEHHKLHYLLPPE